jgi:hypothetical protein
VKFSVVLVVALIVAAGVIIGVRVSSSSNPCPATAQGIGIPGPKPPYTPPTGLQAQGQPQAPLMTISSTPNYKGTPPPGFASWDDYAQYFISHLRALPMGTAVTTFGYPTAGGPSVGGESKLTGC